MSVKVVLKDVIGSYVYVREPRPDLNGKDNYSMQIIIKKNDPQVDKIREAVKSVAHDAFGDKVKLGSLKLPLRDGDEERDEEIYKGCYFFNSKSIRAPQIVNKYNQPATEQDLDEYCYSGATFHVSLNFYSYEFSGNKGIAVGLQNIMLRKQTPRIDGSVSATTEFAEFADKNEEIVDDFADDVPF